MAGGTIALPNASQRSGLSGSIGKYVSPRGDVFAAESAALRRIGEGNRAPSHWSELRRAYQQARHEIDFEHIEADVVIGANGKVKAHGGHFASSGKLELVSGTERVGQNGVILGQVKLLGPDGNSYLKTNNDGFSTLTPESWSLARAKGEMSRAWVNRYPVPEGGFQGTASGVDFQFFAPGKKIPLWRGFPVP